MWFIICKNGLKRQYVTIPSFNHGQPAIGNLGLRWWLPWSLAMDLKLIIQGDGWSSNHHICISSSIKEEGKSKLWQREAKYCPIQDSETPWHFRFHLLKENSVTVIKLGGGCSPSSWLVCDWAKFEIFDVIIKKKDLKKNGVAK